MPKQGEIISLHVGQAGCQVGNAIWEMYCLEHRIRADGVICDCNQGPPPQSFFSQTGAQKAVPRAIFVDLEPTVIDEIRMGKYRSLFRPNQLITGKEDAANCFARGYFSRGKETAELLMHRIRQVVEDCNSAQGFLIFRAYGGGTGSGLVARLLAQISSEYPRMDVFEFSIYPAPKLSSIVVEPYNAALATHQSLEHTTGSFLVDNEACYDICERLLDVCAPTVLNINRLLGQIVSAVTASLRFEGTVNADLTDIKTNLIPYPRLQHTIISYAPLISRGQIRFENLSESSLINSCFSLTNQLVKCDTTKGKYLTCTLLLRGNVTNAAINSAISSIKARKTVQFVDWCPTGFKVGVNSMPPIPIPGGDLAEVDRACTMLANSTAIKTAWAKLLQKFDLMFAKKAFLHWYTAEGLEESDFYDTRSDLQALESDYAEVESNK